MTKEEEIFNLLVNYIEHSEKFEILSAHPPSGKSYSYDLIRIPSPDQNMTGSERDHVDIIFCSDTVLYLCELKGASNESDADIVKLRKLKEYYSLNELVAFIAPRLSFPSEKLKTVCEVSLSIGSMHLNSSMMHDFLYIYFEDGRLIVEGNVTKPISTDFNL